MGKENLFPVIGFVLLASAVWAVYGRAVDAPFIFDDAYSVTGNPSIAHLWPLVGEHRAGALNPPTNSPTSGRPLVNLSLAVNYRLGQLEPSGYHFFNLIVHVLSAMLLMGVVRRTLLLSFFQGRFEHVSRPLSLAVALLWALHPLQTETVVYVTQRTELMVGFFYLATLYASLWYWTAVAPTTRNTWLTLSIMACFCGMACKEVMVTAPVVVLLFERTFIAGSFRRAIQNSWPLYLGLFLSWGLLLALNFSGPRAGTAGFHLGVPASTWWLTQSKVLLMYLKLAVWPWPLAIHYEMPYLDTIGAAWPWLTGAALLSIVALVLLWRRSATGFAGAWVLVILSPTLFVPILTEVAAERRMYLPLAALMALAVAGGYCLLESVSQRFIPNANRGAASRWSVRISVAFTLLAAVVLSLVDVRRLEAYHDPITLWQDLLALNPDDATAHNNLAVALFEVGKPEEAIAQIRETLLLKPEFVVAHYNLGSALGNAGRTADAIEQFQEALRLKPIYPEAHNSLGKSFEDTGRLPEAIEQYQQAVQQKPDFAEAHFNLGVALGKAGRLPEAVEQYQLTLKSRPAFPMAYNNLAGAYAQLQRPAEAIATAEQALEIARAQGGTKRIEQIENWLNAYRAAQANASGISPTQKSSTGPDR